MEAGQHTDFALWLRTELDARGLTIRSFARILNADNPEQGRRNLHRYLSGRHQPGSDMRRRIAAALEEADGP